MSIDRTTDLGDCKVFEGAEADAMAVRLALENEGIRTGFHPSHTVLSRLQGAIYVEDQGQVEQARVIVARHLKGALPSSAALASPWKCRKCCETVESQFEACWNCGTPKP